MTCQRNIKKMALYLFLTTSVFIFTNRILFSGETEVHPIDRVFFQKLLVNYSIHYDCYFTIEIQQGSKFPDMLPKIEWGDISEENARKILDEQIPGFSIFRNSNTCKIYRLRDNSLQNDTSKSIINKRLSNFSFKGSPEELILKIHTTVPEIRQRKNLASNFGPLIFDYSTPVDIPSTSASVYDLLTNYIPLSSYHRIIWKAETSNGKSGNSVVLSYFGSSRIPNKVKVFHSLRNVTLADGEMFYWLVKTKKTPLPEDAILASIAKTLRGDTGGHPLQKRWAIKCLGTLPLSAETESLLLANANYSYSNCGPLEERYPVVSAILSHDADGGRIIRMLIKRDLKPDLKAYLKNKLENKE